MGQQTHNLIEMEQYEQLAAENGKLKMQLGDMIDKYKILYTKIKELQEERSRERQIAEEKKRAEQSINPFSIASAVASSVGGDHRTSGKSGKSQNTA